MLRGFKILIAERNRRIRQFLEREFLAGGYRVALAESGSDLSRIVREDYVLDLLILDDELPGLAESRLVEEVANRIPSLPFILHGFSRESADLGLVEAAAVFVEKTGNIEGLIHAVREVLRSTYPSRFDSRARGPSQGEAEGPRDPAGTMETPKP